MKYAYEDLSPEQFETLILLLCQHLLGVSVQGFAKGPDGGRDAKFVGTAELHPSRAAPWSGIVIIQAKHTNSYNKRFAEADFFSPGSKNTVLAKETPRIRKLRETENLDHYMLFANRRLAGNAESDIRAHIAKECDIPSGSIYLCGVEHLEILLKNFPQVPALAKLDPVDCPLIVSPDELAEIVEAFASQREAFEEVLDDPPGPRILYEEKNARNQMSPEYAVELRRRHLKETAQIRTFLAAPENLRLLQLYESVVDEFQAKIIAFRKDYQSFDRIMEYLLDLLFGRDPLLRQPSHKRLTRALLFYMYWNCDIGSDGDAETNETFPPGPNGDQSVVVASSAPEVASRGGVR